MDKWYEITVTHNYDKRKNTLDYIYCDIKNVKSIQEDYDRAYEYIFKFKEITCPPINWINEEIKKYNNIIKNNQDKIDFLSQFIK